MPAYELEVLERLAVLEKFATFAELKRDRMTYKEAVREFGELEDWYKEKGEVMSWTAPIDVIGTHLFSFDGGKTVFSVFGGGKNELNAEQLEIFRKENPIMAELYIGNKE